MLLVGLLVTLLGVAAIWKKTVRDEFGKTINTRGLGLFIVVVGLLIIGLDSFTVVAPRNVAVQTFAGRPVGTLDNGFHWVAPWTSTTSFDASIQTVKLTGAEDDNGSPVSVNMAAGTTGDIQITIEWRIDDKVDITDLYLEYKEFEKIGKNVVERRLPSVLAKVFEKHDPTAFIDGKESVLLSSYEPEVKRQLQAVMPKGVLINTVFLGRPIFNKEIQARIDQFVAAVGDTRTAEQQKKTAQLRADANNILANAKLSGDVVSQNCLDMVERLVNSGKSLPPAFTCGIGGVTPVLPVK